MIRTAFSVATLVLAVTIAFAVASFALVPTAAAAPAISQSSCYWSDPTCWSLGAVPGSGDQVTIAAGHTVIYDLTSSRVNGVTVEAGGTLRFDTNGDRLLETNANVVVRGELEMRPIAPAIEYTLKFVSVKESAFVGGGMDPLASDVGLWIVGAGVLDIIGSPKTSWSRLSGSVSVGTTTLTLKEAPSGWQRGDQVVVVPTEHPSVGSRSYSGFEVRDVVSVSGTNVTLSAPLSHDHPSAVDPFTGVVHTAEVLNLTRNVRIEGTGDGGASVSSNGRAHVFIRSSVPQTIKHAVLYQLGPRRVDATNPTEGVIGRYPLHLHMAGDGSRGSVVEGVVVHRSGNRAFVPHASHGITFRNTVAFDVWEDAYWWDPPLDRLHTGNSSHGILYDQVIAALIKDDPSHRGFTLTGFFLAAGQGVAARNSVAVGVSGNKTSSGFHWPERANRHPENVWDFSGNVAHNNRTSGIYVWQNDDNDHVVANFSAYRNTVHGIDHGAYGNRYLYTGVSLFENGDTALVEHAGALAGADPDRPDGYLGAFEDFAADGVLEFPRHIGDYVVPALFKDCIFSGVIVDENSSGNGRQPTKADLVNCRKPDGAGIESADIRLVTTLPGMLIRVQRADGTAYRIDHTGAVTAIAPFYAVSDPAPTPTKPSASISANPTSVASGQSSILTWSSTGAVSCTGTNFSTGNAVSGSVTIKPSQTTTYTVACSNESQSASASVTVTVNNAPSTNTITSLTLVNADTDADIQQLTDGTTLDLATLPTRNLNVRANTDPAAVDKVVFDYDGTINYRTESGAPYALAGDRSGNYHGWTPSSGKHALTATPHLDGATGTPLTVNFTVR